MRERKPSCEIGKERGFCKCWDEGKTTGHPESGRNWGGEGGIGEGREELGRGGSRKERRKEVRFGGRQAYWTQLVPVLLCSSP